MRDKLVIDLRPILNLAVEGSNEIESFQNITLRPILKFQNEITGLLLSSSKQFAKLKEKLDHDNPRAYHEMVSKFVGTNTVFKNRLIGVVVGMMTSEEFDFYNIYSSELNKRIITMQIQRYADNVNEHL